MSWPLHPDVDALFTKSRLVLMAGPCVAESWDVCATVAERLQKLCAACEVGYIFKASFDKANRTSAAGARGPGQKEGLALLRRVRETFNLPVVTDIHLPEQAAEVAQVADVLQIPAFLCRQTDLLTAAAATQRPVNVKKGQFLAPSDMTFVADKLRRAGCERVAVTERGTTFGYHNLVVDMRGLIDMAAQTQAPIIFDATHSVQRPGAANGTSGGDRTLAPPLARAAAAVGIDGLFCEVHPDPDSALSDGPNSLDLPMMERLLVEIMAIRRALANPETHLRPGPSSLSTK